MRHLHLPPQFEANVRQTPRLGADVFIAPGAIVTGAVTLGDRVSVWYHAVLRADLNRIEVDEGSNIQDNAVLHLGDDSPCLVGRHVTVGHGALVHGCTVEDDAVIGMGAIVLDGAVIGAGALVGAGAVVTPGTRIPPGMLAVGSPAKAIRPLTDEERARLRSWAMKYVENGAYCLKHGVTLATPSLPSPP